MIAGRRGELQKCIIDLKKKDDQVYADKMFIFFRKWDWLTTTLIMSETTAPTWLNHTADGLLCSQSFSLEMKG